MRLSKEQWAEARATWEADPRAGFDWLAADLGVSRQSVSEMAKRKDWTKGGNPAQENAQVKAGKKPAQEKKNPAQDKRGANVLQLVPPAQKPAAKKAAKASQGPAKPTFTPGTTERIESAEWSVDDSRRPRGRPTEYREEFIGMMIDFFDIEVDEVKQTELPSGKVETNVVVNKFPTLARFASKIGVTRETLHDWATAKNADGTLRRPDFSYAYTRAKDMQEALLTEGGMAGAYDSRFAAFAAKNLIGWKDQIETRTEITTIGATTEELDNFFAEKIAESKAKAAAIQGRGDRLLRPEK